MRKFIFLLLTLLSPFSFSQTWQSVGGGTNNSSHGLLTWNDKLIDLGSFNNPCNRVAEWNGTNWSCLGGGVGIVARAGVVWDGKLVVVGDFWNVFQPCVGCNGVAVWDGVSWTPLGQGVNNDVLSITVWNNQVVIAGDFTQASGVPVSRIVKWNGTAWESVGPIGSFDNDIRAMVEFDGDLWVGGDFNNVGGVSSHDGLVKYDPNTNTWLGGNSGVDLIGGVNESVRVLYVNPNDGNLYMGGEFPELWDGDAPAQDFNMSGIAMYDGSNWTPLGTGLNEYCRAMHEYNGDIVAGGYFTDAGGVSANKIARFDGTTWSNFGLGFDANGIDEYVKSMAVWNGILFAGGAYTQAEGNPMNFISQWYEPPSAPPVAWMTSSTTALCGSGCVYFSDNSTNNPTSWNWSFPGSDVPVSTLQNPGTVCYSSPGTYTATLQACNGLGCTTQNIDIEVSAGATVNVANQSICDGGSATLVAVATTPGGTFEWSTGETTSNIVVSPGSTTNYTVTYTISGCIPGSSNSTVTVGSTATLDLVISTPTICEGETATLTANPSIPGGSFLWSPGGETSASINPNLISTTDYTVSYSINGCESTPQNGTVVVNPIPTVAVSNGAICEGESILITANPTVTGGTYLWSPGGETTSSITVSPTSTSNYTVVYTLNGCESLPEVSTIQVNQIPTVSLSDQTICAGETANIIANPSVSGGTYLWSPGGEITQNILVSPTTTSNYSIIYTLNGCESLSENAIVTVQEIPTVSVNSETVCENSGIVLITASPSVVGGTYLWSPGGETTQEISVPASTNLFSVVYTLNGCSSSAEVSSITALPMPLNSVSQVDAELTAVQSGATYQWLNCTDNYAVILGSNSQNFIASQNGEYAVELTLNGCVDTSDCFVVNSLGLQELFKRESVVFPNPSKENITISNLPVGNYRVKIADLSGKICLTATITESQSIDISSLMSGAYVVFVINSDSNTQSYLLTKL